MKIRIYGVVESGENKRDVEKQLKDKFIFMPELSECIEKKCVVAYDGSHNSEFLIDTDVLIRRMKKTIDMRVSDEVARQMEAWKTKLKQDIVPLEAL